MSLNTGHVTKEGQSEDLPEFFSVNRDETLLWPRDPSKVSSAFLQGFFNSVSYLRFFIIDPLALKKVLLIY